MKIVALAENTASSNQFRTEHGLSLYIETKKHKLLFDVGASDLFIENAEKIGINLAEVDTVVISHGHSDHGGGLKSFLSINSNAKIFLNEKAFGNYFANRPGEMKAYIGLNRELIPNDRFTFVGASRVLDDELELFSNVKGRKLYPSGNKSLFKQEGTSFLHDDFVHEQNLIIREDKQTLLIAGCAHNGIVNIIDHFYNAKGYFPSYVIGGFHLYNPSTAKSEQPQTVHEIGEYLVSTGSTYYTCHCTGIESYNLLKETIGRKMKYLSTGSQLNI